MKKELENKKLAIYQAKDGSIELRQDFDRETIWANLDQIALLFDRDKSVISRHIKNIFKEKELDKKSTVAFFATVQKEGNREVKRSIEFFNLDMIISVGYRVNSKIATEFRQWATRTLKQHITKGFTVNKNLLKKKENLYLQVLEDVKKLSRNNNLISNIQIIDLIKNFSSTWFNLENYDKQNFPKKGKQQKSLKKSFQELADNLYQEVDIFKKELIRKKEATELFAQEKNKKSLEGILGNVLQSVFEKDVYGTVEEKAAHLLYFVIKNHPFNDGNKRTGAFSFIWFLQKINFDFREKITPETLTTLALLIAESNPRDKEKMIGVVLLLLK